MEVDLQRGVASSLPVAARYLVEVVVPRLGSPDRVREKDLAEALTSGLTNEAGFDIAVNRTISIPGWPSLGRSGVDLAVKAPDGYPGLLEAKWCHSGNDKMYEGIWDLFKMALGLRRPDTEGTFLVTGAPTAMWHDGFCGDLLGEGHFTPEELCSRMLPRGRQPRWLAWDDLLYGGWDRYPEEVPAVIATEPVADPVQVHLDQPWLIKAVRISVVDATPVAFPGGWPDGRRPVGARHPKT
jgi:hypothetical protein